jgi:ribosomal protein L11 methyltransferase PrmA/PRMT5 arginine-N-methyltransferase
MYSITDYATMIADAVRIDAYSDALRRAVTPHSVVVDLGSGTGVFGVLACQFGARRVYAIEPDEAIQVARAIATANGVADRIQFLQAVSTDVELTERADVIVSDIRGVLPLFGRHIPSIVDARRRLLGQSGVLIPRRDLIWAALVEAPDLYEKHVTPWSDHFDGLDLRAVSEMLANTWRKVRLSPDQLVSDRQRFAILDYRELEDPNLDATVVSTPQRDGLGHGVCVWFDTELTDGVGLSNAPGEPAAIYGQAFFPFAAPVVLRLGAPVSIRMRADLVGDDYLWQWTGAPCAEADRRKPPTLTQSTLRGVPLGTARLKKGAASHVPTLTTEGEIDLFVLSRMESAVPLGEIARELLSRFPSALRDWNAALGRVGGLSRKYSRD